MGDLGVRIDWIEGAICAITLLALLAWAACGNVVFGSISWISPPKINSSMLRRGEEQRMPVETRELYSSPNGDRWFLSRDPATGRVFIKHEANVPSGGQ